MDGQSMNGDWREKQSKDDGSCKTISWSRKTTRMGQAREQDEEEEEQQQQQKQQQQQQLQQQHLNINS